MRIRHLIITAALLVFANWALHGYRHGVLDSEFLAYGQSAANTGITGTGQGNPNAAPALPEVTNGSTTGSTSGSTNGSNRIAPTADPSCTGSVSVDAEVPSSLDGLVRASPLIIIGTVLEVYPSEYADPNQRRSTIHTQSLISVDQLIRGSLAADSKTIGFAQLGGQIPPFDQSVAGDPIVRNGEQYVLFLHPDNRALPANKSGTARFTATGVWTGKVKIVDGKIQFSCASSAELKAYNNTDVGMFVNVVTNMIRLQKSPAPDFR